MTRGSLGPLCLILACGAPVSLGSLESSGRPDGLLAVGSPVTAVIPLAGALQERVQAAAAGRDAGRGVRLQVVGVEVPETADITIRVFLGLPEADASTPIDDPRYAGVFTFSHEGGAGSKTGFLLDASPALERAGVSLGLDEGQNLDVTLVAVPLREGQGSPAPIRIDRVFLSVASQPDDATD